LGSPIQGKAEFYSRKASIYFVIFLVHRLRTMDSSDNLYLDALRFVKFYPYLV